MKLSRTLGYAALSVLGLGVSARAGANAGASPISDNSAGAGALLPVGAIDLGGAQRSTWLFQEASASRIDITSSGFGSSEIRPSTFVPSSLGAATSPLPERTVAPSYASANPTGAELYPANYYNGKSAPDTTPSGDLADRAGNLTGAADGATRSWAAPQSFFLQAAPGGRPGGAPTMPASTGAAILMTGSAGVLMPRTRRKSSAVRAA
jgi:hypothetical protein